MYMEFIRNSNSQNILRFNRYWCDHLNTSLNAAEIHKLQPPTWFYSCVKHESTEISDVFTLSLHYNNLQPVEDEAARLIWRRSRFHQMLKRLYKGTEVVSVRSNTRVEKVLKWSLLPQRLSKEQEFPLMSVFLLVSPWFSFSGFVLESLSFLMQFVTLTSVQCYSVVDNYTFCIFLLCILKDYMLFMMVMSFSYTLNLTSDKLCIIFQIS